VVVGAGYAGLEGLAEMQDFASDLVELYPRCRVTGLRFILIEARERVMGEIPADLAEYATRAAAQARDRGAHEHHGQEVFPDSIELHSATSFRPGRSAGRRASSRTPS
jgi:NADH dehydrogenase FAD-containing subunit